ncbi:hypothetical protein [Sphingobacterium hotanense]|uniref:hypothetical protein n=1 Tax=Sphingobacterium hotanense TaxID=649196 RepID=UPI0021A2F1FA|nr:hypothetical protein [Sphingobacterium hotanense]MCT1525521.1 hypothetical protein [Sphingobacterium hotanense]
MFRFLHFLALFGYLNILCYEVKQTDYFGLATKESNETFVEVVLEEVLNINHSELPESLPGIIFDDYRIFSLLVGFLPMVMVFTWLLSRLINRLKDQDHPFYLSKTLCLPGYYSFLYRYRPF